MTLSIVFISESVPGSRSLQRLAALRTLGHEVHTISTTPDGFTCETRPTLARRLCYRMRWPLDHAGTNRALAGLDLSNTDVLWLDNAGIVHSSLLRRLKAAHPQLKLVWFSEDDMFNPRHRTRWIEPAIPAFDLWVTTKSFNAEPGELPALGARRILFVNNAFDPDAHFPEPTTDADRTQLGGAIGFIGTFEEPRAASMLALAQAGLPVRVWGNGWERWRNAHPLLTIEGRPLYGAEYRRSLCATAVNLCFLRRFNRDRQTTRSIEIPACGAFMLHERNSEIAGLFHEDVEAAFFDNDAELIAAGRNWLRDNETRKEIAAAGRRRVVSLGLSHKDIVAMALGRAMEAI